MISFFLQSSLEDVGSLSQISNLKELTLDGNPLTLNANYVLYTVGAVPSLIQLDHNTILPALRREAENWVLHHVQPQPDPVPIKPVVKVSQRNSLATTGVAVVRPMMAPSAQEDCAVVDQPATTNPVHSKVGFIFSRYDKRMTIFYKLRF